MAVFGFKQPLLYVARIKRAYLLDGENVMVRFLFRVASAGEKKNRQIVNET